MSDFTTVAIVWLIIILVLIIIEGLTVNLVTVWFAIAAIPAFILALFDTSIILQVVVFGVVATLLLIGSKPFVKKLQQGKTIKTNHERIIEEKAVALEDFGDMKNGYVKVKGMDWLAQSDEMISKGDIVIVKAVTGSKVRVTKSE